MTDSATHRHAASLGRWAVLSWLLLLPAPWAQAWSREVPLELPASFRGQLPGCSGAGMRAQLDLWPDGTFHLQRSCAADARRDDELGRWRRAPDAPVILLYAGREMPLQFALVGAGTLRALDVAGQPSTDGQAFDLTSGGTLQPADIRRGLHGMFRYLADAATFEECLTGRSYPVAMEGDYLALERAYLALAKSPAGAPVMASFDGEIARRPAMEGPSPAATVVVRRFVGLWPGQSCERAMSHASLSSQYWRIARLHGAPVAPAPDRREPHLVLRGPDAGYRATVGCGSLEGHYQVSGPVITFGPPTRSGDCPPGLAELQQSLLEVLAGAHRWAIQGQVLELFDTSGGSLAVMEAIYLR